MYDKLKIQCMTAVVSIVDVFEMINKNANYSGF